MRLDGSRDKRPVRLRIRAALGVVLAAGLVAGLLAGCGSSGPTLSYKPPTYAGWPYVGRDRDNTRYTPQTQINNSTVKHLGVAWSASLGQDQYLMEDFPLVNGNTIYATTSTDVVEAINATTGKILWTYAPEVNFSFTTGVGGLGVSTNRGVALSNGHLFLVTFDDHLQSISASTGEKLWSSEVVSPETGVFEDMSPTVYNGMVFVGGSGGEDGVRGFIAGFSEKTGKELWKTYTIPPRGTSWVCPHECGGGTVYNAPTIDTKTGVLYMGTGSPAPTLLGEKRPGANLYTSSIIAIDAKTGKMLWYYQEVPHNVYGYGAEQPVTIFNTNVGGKTVEAVAEAGKDGYLYILNAKTGKPLFAPVAVVKQEHTTPTRKGTVECPGPVGAVGFSPLSFDPETASVYAGALELCELVTVTNCHITSLRGEKEFCGTQAKAPGWNKPRGTFTAVNVTNGQIAWQRQLTSPILAGATATAGGIVFTADQHGTIYAFDAKNGDTVWQGNIGVAVSTPLEIYSVKGQEYVLVSAGGSALTLGFQLGPVSSKLVALKLNGSHLPGA
jgi:PQQ-dependent dehydrogenase (methanol/ethanol family)